jgi:hypothetical protein
MGTSTYSNTETISVDPKGRKQASVTQDKEWLGEERRTTTY